ncbi:MAG: suppressor of fused domain protein [Alphaproteobacteria bacterium]|nr:suppressor of fused domain protein [Alphaproteobacteria bacterium]
MLERIWTEREKKIYTGLFDNFPEQIHTPASADAVAIGGSELLFSCAGVFEIPPSSKEKYWTYLTSGLSNASEAGEVSGYGIELLLQLPEQAAWPVHLLFNLMGYIMHTGNVFSEGHRIPTGPIRSDDKECHLNTLLFWSPISLPPSFQLESGTVDILQIHAITSEEYAYSKEHSSYEIYDILQKLPYFPAIDIKRKSSI